ncbi:sensor histidine kinase [Actinomadura scrupuli]|uniref:sensor histidine kinase n=1 Tax=Actinomadura scrupuli TaxID=559629 RepID=UPI003D9994D8
MTERYGDGPRGQLGRGLVTCGRGLLQAVLAPTACLALFIVTVLSVAFLPLGVGVPLVLLTLPALRGLAGSQREWAREWSGVAIPVPYRPAPRFDGKGLIGSLQRCKWLLSDPASWRDLLWTLVNVPVGLVLGLLPACLVVYGLEGILVAPWVGYLADGYGYGPMWPLSDYGVLALLSVPLGALLTIFGLWSGPWILRGHALFTRSLLAPTRQAELASRVRRLTETRSDAVDAQAAELRRIERDLHDGAQARLAALGMSIGLAEDLMTKDPETAQRLLAEAREASGVALSELRDLVRGIHPPVLAERGLDGAVRALALALPLPVDVDIELPGRLQAPVESAAYFAVAEAFANVVKHSAAGNAWVRLRHEGGVLSMVVGDDGIGGAESGSGTGLRGIERRLAAFDGTIAMTSPVGGPTVVTMELPCELSSPRTLPSYGTD